jgi:diguanylate cyclase (GGDEF)-like protein
MIAPFELEGRLLGVVYLDSRVAKGVFTDEDIAILTSIANQVAVSLETARAAQLEVAVQAARQQRDTAEALRAAMSELAETLDPEQVLRRLGEIATRTLPADHVVLLHRDGERLTVASSTDRQPDTAGIAAALAVTAPAGGRAEEAPAGLAAVLDGAGCWLATPLTTRGYGHGVLVAASGTDFAQAQLDMAAALAGQGGAAYINARLFAQVQELATTDGLTGVFNRRHFTGVAARQLAVAARNHRPLAAMMVDIDHFKRINDTYGHATGDDVIRAVAGVLQGGIGEPDVLGRYGGEEFAIVMSEMHGNPVDVAERLRTGIEALALAGPAGPIRVTVSIGVAELKPDDDLDGLLARADESLYRAKEGGRNQVRIG